VERIVWSNAQVNSYFSSEQSGFAPDPKNNGNGVNYLRRLKAEIGAEAARNPHEASAGQPAPAGRDRRRSPRFHCTGSVALLPDATQVRMWGTVTDISLRGCYVEMSSTLPIDTKVDMVLDASGIRIRAKGIVRISYPGLGMGILLTELPPEQKELLDQLLSKLSQTAPVPSPQLIQERSAAEALAAVDPISFLNELRRFFDSKVILSREEFFQIADRCQRP
jgi:hypothetical protein